MLSVEHISKSLADFELKDISFAVEPGQYFVVLGTSGVGKSVLLETLAGLIRPDGGRILLDGKDVTDEKIQSRKIGLVFQHSTLFPHMTVADNIAYPLRHRRAKEHLRSRVVELAEEFGVSHLLDAKPGTLSGGESQRVSLARAVAAEPRCLLLDEPLSSLDTKSRSELRAVLRRMNARGEQLTVHVTHDYTECISLGTHVAVMEEGRITQAAALETVFQNPKSEFVARFVGIRNFFRGRLEGASSSDSRLRRFRSDGLTLLVLADCAAGDGFVCVRTEDVTIYSQHVPGSQTSARNNFEGTITDVVPAAGGVEVIVDVGSRKPLEVAAMVTAESVMLLGLRPGKKVWISFKASAAKYIEA